VEMVRKWRLTAAIVCIGIWLLTGCGGSGSVSESDNDGANTVYPVGELGDLVDVGDFDNADGSWKYTKISAMDDDGNVAGQSNYGTPSRAAFLWPATGGMTYLGIHSLDYLDPSDNNGYEYSYDDYYDLDEDEEGADFATSQAVAVFPNSGTPEAIGNSITDDENEKRAFYWDGAGFVDLPPMYYEISFTVVDNDKNETEYTGYVMKSASEAAAINGTYILVNLEDEEGTHAYYWDKSATTSIKVYDEKFEDYDDVDGDSDDDNDDDDDDVDAEPPYVNISVPDYQPLGNVTGDDTEAVAINDSNQVIVNVGGGDSVIFYNDIVSGESETLEPFTWASTIYAAAINEDGNVVGTSGDDAFFWNRTSGSMTVCGYLDGDASVATDLNNSNQVVGYATNEDGDYHAFLWKSGRGTTDLGTLGGDNSYALAINDNGVVTGVSETGETYSAGSQEIDIYHACIWYKGELYDIGVITDFDNAPDGVSYPFSTSVALNANNRVAGNSITVGNHYRGFILDPDTTIIP